MRIFKNLFAIAFVTAVFVSCSEKEAEQNPDSEYDEEWYAAHATVTSSDANFTATDNGGTINFKAGGGTVTLNVDCGCNWIAQNKAEDLFSSSVTSNSLTVTAEQNTVMTELSGTITLMTEIARVNFATISITQAAYGAPEITVETAEWNAPAKGVLTVEMAVNASADWTAESADEWLTVEKTDTGLSLTAEENGETKGRNTKVTLTCTDGIRTAYDYVTVTQDALAYITLDSEALSFVAEGGQASVAVESNYEWEYSFDDTDGWLTIGRNGDVLNVSAAANGSENSCEAVVTLSAGDGGENVADVQLTIFQSGDGLTFVYSVSSTDMTIMLPLYGDVDCTVNWGDGSDSESVNSTFPTHIYSDTGEYKVVINGKVTALNSREIYYTFSFSLWESLYALISVENWGNTGFTDLSYAFYQCKNLESVSGYGSEAFSEVESLDFTFAYCSSLKSVPADLFVNCGKATSLGSVFAATGIETIPAGLFDNCTESLSFRGAFNNCTSLKSIPENLFSKTLKVTDFSSVFSLCSSLTSVPAGLFDGCTAAESFNNAFGNCASLETIPEGLFANMTNCTDFNSVFYNCKMKELPKNLFANCTSAKTFSSAFQGCSYLESVDGSIFTNCPAVEDFSHLFGNDISLTTINEGLFDGCVSVTTFEELFYYCRYLTEIPSGLFDSCTKVTTFYRAFYYCERLGNFPAGLFDNCTEVTTFEGTFYCSGITMVPEGFFKNQKNVTAFVNTFYGCTALKSIPEGLFSNQKNATDFQNTFYGCSSLESIPEGLFSNQKNATNFGCTFYNCSSLTGESAYDLIDGVKVHLYDRTTDLGFTLPTVYDDCYFGCRGLDDYQSMELPASWR